MSEQPEAVAEDPATAIPPAPASAVAARLADALRADPEFGLAYLAIDERRAEAIGLVLRQLAPDAEVLVYPPWDTLAYERAPPSRESQGRRIAARARLATAGRASGRAWISSPEAMLQRAPQIAAAAAATLTLAPGGPITPAELAAFAADAGYVVHDPVDDAGEISSIADVIDIWPGDASAPVRASFAEGRLSELHRLDALTQRSAGALDAVVVTAVVESAFAVQDPFDALADWRGWGDPGIAERAADGLEQVREAYATRLSFGDGADQPPPPEARYLDTAEIAAGLARLGAIGDLDAIVATPVFARSGNPGRSFCDYVQARLGERRRVVIGGLEREVRAMARALKRGCDLEVRTCDGWTAALAAPAKTVVAVTLDVERGFDDPVAGLTLISGPDVLGGHLTRRPHGAAPLVAADLALGDVVIHEDHGLGVLRALERVDVDGREQDAVRLEYHAGATLLVGVDAFDRLWRYGSDPTGVAFDRLHTDAWNRRRVEISAEIDRTAAHLVEVARERATAEGVVLKPPKAAYARFAARFAYPETPDQADAIAAVEADLASGRAMDRLVCGDVGFGKTEVALRAAAIAALAGRQVAVVAPTTVLARQHVESFTRRFGGTGVAVGQLSRLTTAAEARRVKAGLADGSIGVVVGTHAVAAHDVVFKDLVLVIVDEEQRFGAKLKAQLHALAPGAHRLTLTATPIPRTLQLAMIGVQDVSVIATPPSRRRPIRTLVTLFDDASVRTALLREHRRGGQSFVVAPRIEDLEALQDKLSTIAPELSVRIAHGELPAGEVDAAMVDFAAGDGDVLLATSIIESGLDVPRANTMIVWRPDRFGLAQLHQLRGRVGRGRVQGVAYLLTDGETPLPEATAARLATLQALERLGAGLAISARDLDLRGAGDLAGDDQAGHLQLIGADLYQALLTRAIRAAKGEPASDWTPELHLPSAGALPADYVPDATLRLNLYARLARLRDVAEVHAFEEELEDRFGTPPNEVTALLDATRLRTLARAAGVTRIDAGPRAIAMRFHDAATDAVETPDGAHWKDRRLVWPLAEPFAAQVRAIETQLKRWADATLPKAA